MSSIIAPFLSLMVDKKASDLYISVDAQPCIKIEGKIVPVRERRLDECEVPQLVHSVLNDEEVERFERERELDLSFSLEKIGRFRINVYHQRGFPAMVIRHVKDQVPSIEELALPAVFKDLAMEQSGLILLAGSTGSGKSTTMASLIEHRNQTDRCHILTIEDPIEYWHRNHKCIIDQREVGLDTHSYESALKHALREDPDIIMIGETRDYETLRQVVSYADSGHLCLTSLHAHSAQQVIHRMINFYPEKATKELLTHLATNLKAIVCQRLVQGENGKRELAIELMLNTPYIADLILANKIDQIPQAMEKGFDSGCLTFDRSLRHLFEQGRISEETALNHASSKTNMKIELRKRAPQGKRVA